MSNAQRTIDAEGVVQSVAGSDITILFDRPAPRFQNLGYDHFEAEGFRVVRISGTLPMEYSQITLGFQNWVQGQFTDGKRALFLIPHTSAWNDVEKRYDKPIYSIVG